MIFALVGSIALSTAQEKVKNTYEKEGNLIKATLFHDNGVVSQTGYYTKDGKLQGTWISYTKEGKKSAVAQYEKGQKVGKWFFWNDDTLQEVNYDNSKITSVNTWESKGERVVSNNE